MHLLSIFLGIETLQENGGYLSIIGAIDSFYISEINKPSGPSVDEDSVRVHSADGRTQVCEVLIANSLIKL